MAEAATTTGGSRTFSDGVKVSWTPSSTTNVVHVEIDIGGNEVWQHDFNGNDTASFNQSGDNYSIKGTMQTQWNEDGTSGTLSGDMSWTVQQDSHSYDGVIGSW